MSPFIHRFQHFILLDNIPTCLIADGGKERKKNTMERNSRRSVMVNAPSSSSVCSLGEGVYTKIQHRIGSVTYASDFLHPGIVRVQVIWKNANPNTILSSSRWLSKRWITLTSRLSDYFFFFTMMSLAQSTTKALRPLVRQAVPVRSMTVMNKQSSEEYKKKVRKLNMKNMVIRVFGGLHHHEETKTHHSHQFFHSLLYRITMLA
jgi:hypothetical protein